MHRLSSSLRMDICGSVFAAVVALLIMFGVYLLFRWGGMGAQAERGLLGKGLPVIGFVVSRDAFRFWRRYKAEQGAA